MSAVFDIDAFEERAAIMEYDGGLSRFEAETAAAKAQGFKRHEAINAIRNISQARDPGSADARNAAGALPRVQPAQAQEKRSVLVGNVPAGRDPMALLALWNERR